LKNNEKKKMIAKKFLSEFKKVGRLLYQEGIVHATSGNMSLRNSKKTFLITAHDCCFGDINDSSIVEVSLDSRNLDRNASVEVVVHREIYKRTSAKAIVHCHPIFATVLSFFSKAIKPRDIEGSFYIPEVPVIDIKQSIASERVAQILPEFFKRYRVVFLKGHGSWVVGDTLFDCFKYTSILESSSKILYYRKFYKGGLK